jgi:hypothetical protein
VTAAEARREGRWLWLWWLRVIPPSETQTAQASCAYDGHLSRKRKALRACCERWVCSGIEEVRDEHRASQTGSDGA